MRKRGDACMRVNGREIAVCGASRLPAAKNVTCSRAGPLSPPSCIPAATDVGCQNPYPYVQCALHQHLRRGCCDEEPTEHGFADCSWTFSICSLPCATITTYPSSSCHDQCSFRRNWQCMELLCRILIKHRRIVSKLCGETLSANTISEDLAIRRFLPLISRECLLEYQ